LLVCFSVLADEGEAGGPDEGDAQGNGDSADEGFWAGYLSHVDERIKDIRAREHELWGIHSLTVPRGVFSLKFIANCKRAESKYHDDGTCGPVIEPISFADPFGGGGEFMRLDVDVKGHGCGYVFRLFYGVTDPLDVFLNFQFQTEEMWLDVDFVPGTSSLIGIRTKEDMYELLELLGRPRPKTHYRSKSMELADTDIGILYNYFCNSYVSAMVKPRIFFPTGHLADPNSALIFALGPEIDVGKGSYGLGLTHNLDLRPPKPVQWLVFGSNVNYMYFFRGRRQSPKFLKPDPTTKRFLDSIGFESAYFPDLSDLDDHYYVTPGHQLEAVFNLMFSKSFFGAGIGYGFLWQQEPLVETSSEEFERMMDMFNSYSEAEAHAFVVAMAFKLFYFNIPAILNLEARYPIGGRNYFKFEDDYKLDFQAFVPF